MDYSKLPLEGVFDPFSGYQSAIGMAFKIEIKSF